MPAGRHFNSRRRSRKRRRPPPAVDAQHHELPDFACGLTETGAVYLTWPVLGEFVTLTPAQARLVADAINSVPLKAAAE